MPAEPAGSPATRAALYDGFARVGRALASGRRLEILDLLAQAPRTVGDLAAELGISDASASQHLQVLAGAGLVDTRRRGRHVACHLARPEAAALLSLVRTLAAEQVPEVAALVDAHLAGRRDVPWITRSEVRRRLARGEVLLVDVRPAVDYAAGHIPGSRSAPAEDVLAGRVDLPRHRDLVVCCRGPFCALGDAVVAHLRSAGRRAFRLEDGVPEWIAPAA